MKKILVVIFVLIVLISMISIVSASNVPVDTWVWEVTTSVNDCPHNWRVVIPMGGQKGPDGFYHIPVVDLNVKLNGYPKTIRGHYSIYLNKSDHPFRLIQSGLLTWDYIFTRYDAVAVDDFIAQGYEGATWHFVLVGDKLILSDYYDAYKPEIPGNTTEIPVSGTNTTIPLLGKDTIPMQNTGMPITPLVIALISITGALLYPRDKE